MYFVTQLDLGLNQLYRRKVARDEKPAIGNSTESSGIVPDTAEGIPAPYLSMNAKQKSYIEMPYRRLADEMALRMTQLNAMSNAIEPAFATKRSLNEKFTLEATSYTLSVQSIPIAIVRSVYICGAKNEILNSWIFPIRSRWMPIYAAELIGVGGVNRVAFVDLQVPGTDQAIAADTELLTEALAIRYSSLPCDEPPPQWAIDASQGNFVYARSADSSWTSAIQDCYLSYLDAYLQTFVNEDTASKASRSMEESDREALHLLHNYQRHHMENSPGKKFLGNLFGSDWTHEFMTQFLFSSVSE